MRPDSVGGAETKVFISYSRRDREFALRLADALGAAGVSVFRDLDDIAPTEEWWPRIEQLIGQADTVVFVITPDSVASEVCGRELELCRRLNKRLAPIVHREASSATIPTDLSKLNFIFCTERDDFRRAVSTLVAALSTDIDWIREHTRVGELAQRWERKNGGLLAGNELDKAEAWAARRPSNAPALTETQRAYLAAGREAAIKRARGAADMTVAENFHQQRNYGAAVEAWRRAAAEGNPAAMVKLGEAYIQGQGVAVDPSEARRWLECAAEAGDALGMLALGMMYEGGEGVPRDPVAAWSWYRRAADLGSPIGLTRVGTMLVRGEGVAQDMREGARLIEQAAHGGFPFAMGELGRLHEEGLGVSPSLARAQLWYRRAAEAQDPQGCFRLGMLHLQGKVDQADEREGANLVIAAARLNWVPAMHEAGLCYHEGKGVAYDHSEALRWLRRAAEHGYRASMQLLDAGPLPRRAANLGRVKEEDYIVCPECGGWAEKSRAESAAVGVATSSSRGVGVSCPNCRYAFDKDRLRAGDYDAARRVVKKTDQNGCTTVLSLVGGVIVMAFVAAALRSCG